ncbi:MAG: phosphatidylinositol-4- kinase [Chrysothrix sp. TS-e1954]|nr:MAG: phosphatidylinositol-4- kinase [Chrysothrix sp. TS-e1954]
MLESHTVRSEALAKLCSLSNQRASRAKLDPRFLALCETQLFHEDVGDANDGHDATYPAQTQHLMTFREFETILAVSGAVRSECPLSRATRLLAQLSPYVLRACSQRLRPSPHFRSLAVSPWQLLSAAVVGGLLQLGLAVPAVRGDAVSASTGYLRTCADQAVQLRAATSVDSSKDANIQSLQKSLDVLALGTSLLGFLDVATRNPGVWSSLEQCEILHHLNNIISESFLLMFEAAISEVRDSSINLQVVRDWKFYLGCYSFQGTLLGAMLMRHAYVRLAESFASLKVTNDPSLQRKEVMQSLIDQPLREAPQDGSLQLIGVLAETAARVIVDLEEGYDYLSLGSSLQQRLLAAVKSSALACFTYCYIANEDAAEKQVLLTWLDSTLEDPVQTADTQLACTTLRCLAVLANTQKDVAFSLTRSIPRHLMQGVTEADISSAAADCLLISLKNVPQDAMITTLYALGNSLKPRHAIDPGTRAVMFDDPDNDDLAGDPVHRYAQHASTTSLTFSESTESAIVQSAIVHAIVVVAKGLKDKKTTALAIPMLVQKVGKLSLAADLKIISETAILAVDAGGQDFQALLRLYDRLSREALSQRNEPIMRAVQHAWDYLGLTLPTGSLLHGIYARHLREEIVSKGDADHLDSSLENDEQLLPQELGLLLRPLSRLTATLPARGSDGDLEEFSPMQRDAWYNLVVHGFTWTSFLVQMHFEQLRVMACHAQPLSTRDGVQSLESEIELNVVLRRSLKRRPSIDHKRELIALMPQRESDIRSLSHAEMIFLQAAYLVESLRASSGDCSKVMLYFVDPSLHKGALGNCMTSIALNIVDNFITKTVRGEKDEFSASFASQQLSIIFQFCCHRIERVQQVAYACVERMIANAPPIICQRSAIFSLLDILTIMWRGCLHSEIEEYDWNFSYTSDNGTASVELSDNAHFRRQSLRIFNHKAREWIVKAMNIAALDVKGLLQTYLLDYGDEETSGHMALGRSLALELGSKVPQNDERLGAIDNQDDLKINTASEFMAHYTLRQDYRSQSLLEFEETAALESHVEDRATQKDEHSYALSATVAALERFEYRVRHHENVSLPEMKGVLRKAASLLCRSTDSDSKVLDLFVRIPFAVFTKEAIKLGLSLWAGVIKENPYMESRLLVELTENWTSTVRGRIGVFSDRLGHPDPFYLKEEFAPSDGEALKKQQKRIQDLIAPHFRILQFLESHYHATRLNGVAAEKSYHRFLQVTLRGLRQTSSHPLSREIHFRMLSLGLKILRHSTSLAPALRWRLKDDLLSVGLDWFSNPPRWSFGGNRLRLKAETHILANVAKHLRNVTSEALESAHAPLALQSKQNLLHLLLIDEQTRLLVWLFPLDHKSRHHFLNSSHQDVPSSEMLAKLIRFAWKERPSLAINVTKRFLSQEASQALRTSLMSDPVAAMEDPHAVLLMLGNALPDDISSQLKYLTYWAPVSPITAVTLFMPAYGNHPCIIQYAVKALENHSVDVTFFYVPQIVQTLRYDSLGYVERYIVETAKFSQLFAHQIIWNMKANAYKDEDSNEPDPLKPTLDSLTHSLLGNFSSIDRDFYKREFDFFDQITGISGKLRPFIKKSKPEKKQKIEEELRQIQLDVGVYLPSNPDGVVVGIDRKSGKPLQSHAKAPYMATFRIRKEGENDMENTENQLGEVNAASDNSKTYQRMGAYEIWQSAIFKVGDDCRQDVLALQMIAAFRGIFHHVGLPVFVFPYRVTATAPGCGIIDVLPNAISRDMLGREAVNGLYEWFSSRFGNEEAPAYQIARANFVKSLAAYSVISYLLQFKDRHNGNIMYDEEGHILHIDFGFCFDIAPGGVRFERAPFKLTKEMVAVMGGSAETQSFRWFEELCVKAFLASRPYVDALAHLVVCMLDSGLPCFKPETIEHFKQRFVLEKNEMEAAEFMRMLVRKSHASYSTKGYDQFQLLTNGIPY